MRHRSVLCPLVLLMTLGISVAIAEERSHQLATATEVFQLRGACVSLGTKILDDNAIGSALTKDQVSFYNPRTNRCYVELTVMSADFSNDYFNRNLYDGQTKELLAVASIKKGKKYGMVFDKQHHMGNLENAGWDDATRYIDAMMADDRR